MSENALHVYTIAHDALLGGAITRKPLFAKTIAIVLDSFVPAYINCGTSQLYLYHSPAYGVLLGWEVHDGL